MTEYKIITDTKLERFENSVNEMLINGWKLHGYTQFPLETSKNGLKVKYSSRGQWSQSFIK